MRFNLKFETMDIAKLFILILFSTFLNLALLLKLIPKVTKTTFQQPERILLVTVRPC